LTRLHTITTFYLPLHVAFVVCLTLPVYSSVVTLRYTCIYVRFPNLLHTLPDISDTTSPPTVCIYRTCITAVTPTPCTPLRLHWVNAFGLVPHAGLVAERGRTVTRTRTRSTTLRYVVRFARYPCWFGLVLFTTLTFNTVCTSHTHARVWFHTRLHTVWFTATPFAPHTRLRLLRTVALPCCSGYTFLGSLRFTHTFTPLLDGSTS